MHRILPDAAALPPARRGCHAPHRTPRRCGAAGPHADAARRPRRHRGGDQHRAASRVIWIACGRGNRATASRRPRDFTAFARLRAARHLVRRRSACRTCASLARAVPACPSTMRRRRLRSGNRRAARHRRHHVPTGDGAWLQRIRRPRAGAGDRRALGPGTPTPRRSLLSIHRWLRTADRLWKADFARLGAQPGSSPRPGATRQARSGSTTSPATRPVSHRPLARLGGAPPSAAHPRCLAQGQLWRAWPSSAAPAAWRGAALLAASAALHAGAGRVFVGLLDGRAAARSTPADPN